MVVSVEPVSVTMISSATDCIECRTFSRFSLHFAQLNKNLCSSPANLLIPATQDNNYQAASSEQDDTYGLRNNRGLKTHLSVITGR